MLQLFSLYCVVTCLAGASLTAELPPEESQPSRSGIVLVDDFQYFPPGPLALETAPPALEPAEAPAPIPAGSDAYQYSAEPQAQTLPALTSTEHLREAVRHLREAGFGEDADRIQRQADELKEMRLQEVAEKKKQIAELQANVEKLELELGMAAQYMVVFSFCELDLNKFRSMKTTWESLVKGDPKKIPAKNEENFIPSGIVDEQKFSAAIQTLESIGALKILSNKRVCAYANQPSAYLSGEEVEVIQQTAGGPPTVARRLVGETLIATVIPRGENRSLLKLTSEFSGYGTRMITSADGRKFPEIYSRPLQTAVELKDEETLVLVSPQAKEDLVVHFIAVKVSPIRPMSSRPAAAETP